MGEIRKSAVKFSCASPKAMREITKDLGIHENLLYNWRRKYTAEGDKSKYATLEEENRALRRELAETRLERDMLKKQRPTSRITKRKISIYTGSSRVPCCEVGWDIASRANELLFLAPEPGSF